MWTGWWTGEDRALCRIAYLVLTPKTAFAKWSILIKHRVAFSWDPKSLCLLLETQQRTLSLLDVKGEVTDLSRKWEVAVLLTSCCGKYFSETQLWAVFKKWSVNDLFLLTLLTTCHSFKATLFMNGHLFLSRFVPTWFCYIWLMVETINSPSQQWMYFSAKCRLPKY